MNSFKMKLSVLLGIAHMSLGIFLKASNAIYFRRYLDFFFEFLPQIILLWLLFGYMDFLIICKWLTDYTGIEGLAPSVTQTLIGIPLNGGEITGKPFFTNKAKDPNFNKNVSNMFFCK